MRKQIEWLKDILEAIEQIEKYADFTKRQDLITEWPLYEAFAQKGAIRISSIKDLTKSSGNWKDWFALTQSGVRQSATIMLTNQSVDNGKLLRYGDIDVLWFNV